MIEHSYRSYIFARALGEVEGIECDEEALFAATMFHDYAFPTIESLTDRCFTVAGAEAAERFLESSPLSEELRHDVLDAICLHINPWVDRERGAIQYLAHDGISLDVVGLRAWEVDRAGARRVFERHPRHGFNAARRDHDESRTAQLVRRTAAPGGLVVRGLSSERCHDHRRQQAARIRSQRWRRISPASSDAGSKRTALNHQR